MACFALNNMGVTMLEKRNYREATKTFKAAMLALRSLEPDSHTIGQERAAFLSDRLHKAASLAAQEKKKSSTVRRHTTTNKSNYSSRRGCDDDNDIEIASMDDNDQEAMEAAQHYGPTSTIVFPIRLRELPSSETIQADGLDTQISIILYNAGIAQLLTYFYRKKKNRNSFIQKVREEKALTKACRLLSMADSAMTRSIHRHGRFECCRIIDLASLVLAGLSVTFRYQQNTNHVEQIEERLQRLERKRAVLERHSLTVSREQLAAAAA